MDKLTRSLVVVLVVLLTARGLIGCGKSSEQLCSEAREDIAHAKGRRDSLQLRFAKENLTGTEVDRALAERRKDVDDVARKARAIPNCNIDDLVGQGVGR